MKIALVLAALTLLVLATEAVNIKKKYCGNQEYIGNPGSIIVGRVSSLFLKAKRTTTICKESAVL